MVIGFPPNRLLNYIIWKRIVQVFLPGNLISSPISAVSRDRVFLPKSFPRILLYFIPFRVGMLAAISGKWPLKATNQPGCELRDLQLHVADFPRVLRVEKIARYLTATGVPRIRKQEKHWLDLPVSASGGDGGERDRQVAISAGPSLRVSALSALSFPRRRNTSRRPIQTAGPTMSRLLYLTTMGAS